MMKIPNRFPSLRVWSVLDIVLAIICWIFQIAASSGYAFYFESLGSGFWIGLLFFITALVGWRAASENRLEMTVGCVLVLSIESFIGGFVLLGVNAAAIDQLADCYASYTCSVSTGLDAILLLCGILAIVFNAAIFLVVLTSLKVVRPSATTETAA